MAEHRRFHLRSLDDLRAELARLDLSIPLSEDLSILGEPLPIGKWTLPNRFAAQPMEGFDSSDDGTPGELSFRRYRRYAEGGSSLIWFEATAVVHEARSNAHQLMLCSKNVDTYARLVEATRDAARKAFGHEIVMVVQLTHSGRYSKPGGIARPIIAHHSAVLDPIHKLGTDYPLVTDDYLDRLQDVYVEAAKLAVHAGFDGIDLKSCHRYLVSELLASFTREGRYGGSLENRSRFLRETMARIVDAVPGILPTTRMNVYDAIPFPYGFGVSRDSHRVPDLAEPIEIIRQLRAIGIPMINISIGNPYYNPFYGRPFDRPIVGAPRPEEHPLEGVVRFLGMTRRIQREFPDLPVVGSGYGWLRHLMPYAAAGTIQSGGAALVGQGRGAFAYPNSPKDILTVGRMDPDKTCVTCSGCTQIMRDGAYTGCVIRDSEIYGPSYQLARRFALDNLRQHAERCHDCEFATCSAHCPANVNVPGFLRAFANNDIRKSYEILREANALPEMCGRVCPAEVQCEGACIERLLGTAPVPIRDIQLTVSRTARREGWAAVRIPENSASGRRIAVVGGGPAGLACAVALVEHGHAVTIIEKGDRLGGTPDDMIPEERYGSAQEEIDAIIAPAKEAGRLEIRYQTALGRDVSLADLRRDFDAVFLACGLGGSTSLGQADGVVDALKYLRDVKAGRIRTAPNRVAVLGGGNTAMDAAATAKRLGARDVFLVYRRSFAEMPAWPNDRDHTLSIGVHLLILSQPVGYKTDSAGKLTALRVARTELGEPDASGRRAPKTIPNSESEMAVDLVIEAIGQTVSSDLRGALGDLQLSRNGLIVTLPNSAATSLPGVFAGGDLVNGGTTAVQGIADGYRAAAEITASLRESN